MHMLCRCSFVVILIAPLSALAQTQADIPTLSELIGDESFELVIPSVGYMNAPGYYQDVVLQTDNFGDTWALKAAEVGELISTVADVEEIVFSDEIPVQVFLRVQGTFASACTLVGTHGISIDGYDVNVFLYSDFFPGDCIDTEVSFEKVIQLPTYGLAAGTYSYSVNGEFIGQFELTEKNVLAD
ncbi:MAG: hypothetical protein WDZ76_02995 [Pseudohongiellaceae bacterium]